MKESLLKIDKLNVTFDTPKGLAKAVNGISFDLAKGEKLGLVGESGSGKSVTAKSIIRLLQSPPASIEGQIALAGEELLTKPEAEMRKYRGNKISMIFQEPMVSLNPLFTVGNQLIEPLKLHKQLGKKDAEAKAVEMLRHVGIPSPEQRMKQYPFELSGGMRQRIMIAMALLCEPRVLIADEPTTALDVTIQAQIIDLLNRINREFGTAIILITHDLGVVAEMVDTVAVMYGGYIMEKAPVVELYEKPLHPYTQGLLNSVPSMNDDREELKTIEGQVNSIYNQPVGCAFHPRCPLAHERCRTEVPPDVLKDGRLVKCWNYAAEDKRDADDANKGKGE